MFCCLTASTARALLCMADAEFGIQVIVGAVVACPEPEHWLFSIDQDKVWCSVVPVVAADGQSTNRHSRALPPSLGPPRWPSDKACAGIFSGSSHTSDLKIGTPVATLPGAWRYRVSSGTARSGVSILWLGEVERLICNFCLSVAARRIA